MVTFVLSLFTLIHFPIEEKPVTTAEKKAFLELIVKLPTAGEFFTEEAQRKAAPYTRVLLALTEEDVKGYDPYGFFALSAGLMVKKEPREYGLKNFDRIAHPELKLFWAAKFLQRKEATAQIVKYLKNAMASKEGARSLAEMCGPDFEDFRKLLDNYQPKEKKE